MCFSRTFSQSTTDLFHFLGLTKKVVKNAQNRGEGAKREFDEACMVSFRFSINESESRHYSVGFTAANFQVTRELLKNTSPTTAH